MSERRAIRSSVAEMSGKTSAKTLPMTTNDPAGVRRYYDASVLDDQRAWAILGLRGSRIM